MYQGQLANAFRDAEKEDGKAVIIDAFAKGSDGKYTIGQQGSHELIITDAGDEWDIESKYIVAFPSSGTILLSEVFSACFTKSTEKMVAGSLKADGVVVTPSLLTYATERFMMSVDYCSRNVTIFKLRKDLEETLPNTSNNQPYTGNLGFRDVGQYDM